MDHRGLVANPRGVVGNTLTTDPRAMTGLCAGWRNLFGSVVSVDYRGSRDDMVVFWQAPSPLVISS
jgi:hypothetical protein